jgi:hypothetical protein
MSALHTNAVLCEKEQAQILAHLEEVLQSHAFAGSRRRQAFLRYVVEETLAGRGATIKETNIAVDVFGRSNNFDAQTASIVRVTAAEVRKRLAQAYEAGLDRELRIELPLGGYQPAFHFVPVPELVPETIVVPQPEQQTASPALHHRLPSWLIPAIAACVFVALAAPLTLKWAHSPSSLDLLWRPFLSQDRPVLISLAAPSTLLYMPNHDKYLPLQPGGTIPTSELEVLDSSYVGTGAALGAALFAEQLATRGQHFALKFGNDISFADLKQSPAVLIGTSRWTQELTKPLRFKIQSVGDQLKMIDSQGADKNWVIPRKWESPQLAEGYSLVTRLLNSESGYAVMIVVGMDARNTQAAVEFLSRGSSFDLFAKSAPKGWENSNFQIVLHNTIHGNSAGSLDVVASHVW